MRANLMIVLVLVFASGCNRQNSQEITNQADTYANAWADMGMWLPNDTELSFFSTNFDVVSDVLIAKLNDPKEDVRQRAAFVIEQIGPRAKSLQPTVVTALAKEQVPVVRIYLCNALRATGEGNEEALVQLRKMLDNKANNKDAFDQRIYAAAALSVLSKDAAEISKCTDQVCQSLALPPTGLSAEQLETHWDQCWTAVNAVEHMPSAQQAIPLLEQLLTANGHPGWIEVHVPRALAALKGIPAAKPQPVPAQAQWTPPANPDPQAILNEAQVDMIAGRYPDALAKHIWFYNNALTIDRSFYGVRLSFALMYWSQLGQVYPPAKAKLLEVRDEAREKVKKTDEGQEAFNDFASINSVLKDDSKTVTLFKELAKDNPDLAHKVFELARPALIRSGELNLCCNYIEPKTDYARSKELFATNKKMSANAQFGSNLESFNQQSFANEVETLVALLVVGNRKSEAESIVADAKGVWNDKSFAAGLEDALKGKVPTPWP